MNSAPTDIQVIAQAVIALLKIAASIRQSLQRTGEWTPEQEATFDAMIKQVMTSEPQWKV